MTAAASTLTEATREPSGQGPHPIRFAVYAEVNMNLIDGSSVWLQSVSQMLTRIDGVEVTLLLRASEERDVLTAPLHANDRIQLVSPDRFGHEEPMDVEEALEALQILDREREFDVVFLRGAEICARASRRRPFPGRMWCYYLTPHDFETGQEIDQLRLIAPASARVLCQTEPIRELGRVAVPDNADKLTLLPPMIPEVKERKAAYQRRRVTWTAGTGQHIARSPDIGSPLAREDTGGRAPSITACHRCRAVGDARRGSLEAVRRPVQARHRGKTSRP